MNISFPLSSEEEINEFGEQDDFCYEYVHNKNLSDHEITQCFEEALQKTEIKNDFSNILRKYIDNGYPLNRIGDLIAEKRNEKKGKEEFLGYLENFVLTPEGKESLLNIIDEKYTGLLILEVPKLKYYYQIKISPTLLLLDDGIAYHHLLQEIETQFGYPGDEKPDLYVHFIHQ